MKKTMSIAAALVLACGATALAQEGATYTWTQFHRVHLRNGNCLEGSLVSRSDASVTLRQPWGEILIRSDQIDRVEFVKIKSFKDPEMIVQRHKAAPAAVAKEISAESTAAAALSERMSDSGEAVPASIPADVVAMVDRAIGTWKSSASNERQDLAEALKGLGLPTIPYLEFLLEKRTQTTPLPEVAQALAALDEERFIEFAKGMLAASSMAVREAAMSGLVQTNSPKRLPVIMQALEDTDPSVWKPATDALLEASKSAGAKSDLLEYIAARIRLAKNKTALAIAVSRIGGADARRVLWDLVDDSDETNRLTGLHGLSLMGDQEDGNRLIGLLRDSSDMVKKGACMALGKMKFGPAVGDLVDLLSDENPGLSKNLRWALKEITGQLVADNNQSWKEWWESAGSRTERFKR
jgi:HEAT repeat protein